MTPPVEDPKSPLNVLRQLFKDVQMNNIKRGAGWSSKRQPTAKTKERKKALKKAWAQSRADRHIEVASCPKCRAWFPSFEARNTHRLAAHGGTIILGKAA